MGALEKMMCQNDWEATLFGGQEKHLEWQEGGQKEPAGQQL